MRRGKMSRGHSRKVFRRGTGTHVRNMNTAPVRGGIRL